jgi:propane monooxygenase reductase subunit
MSATATYKVRFEPVGLEMEIIEGETVLDAAFRQGIALPHGCKEGQCGSCKAKIHEGDFELLKYSTFALPDYESEDGSVLLCRTHVYGDVTVDLLNFDEELLSRAIVVKDFHGRLTRIDALTHDIRMLEMEVEAPVRFWAGQYVDLMIVGRGIVRAYSMASPPSAGNRLQFIVKKYPNGAFSALLDDGLAVGDAMTAKGPYGTCFRREKRSGAMLLIGGGSGMSPLWSILTDHLESGEQRPVRFFYGARTPCMPTRSMRAWQTATRSKRRSGPKRMAISTICAGRSCLDAGANPVELVEGLELAVTETIAALKRSATSLDGAKGLRAIASIAANDTKLGAMVAEAFERAGNQGIVAVEFGNTVETTLEVVEGMAFERGYLSHHMVTDVERMQAVLDNPYILMTDHKIQAMEELAGLFGLIEKSGRPLLIIAEEVAPPVTMQLLARRERTNVPVARPCLRTSQSPRAAG